MSREEIFHSVRLDESKCKGCTHCIRRCPTEAIRVKGGKARINEERCIDCGECIRTCPNYAKYAQSDPLEAIKEFKYTIALPAPAFYAQFKFTLPLSKVLSGLLKIGFHDVFEVARGAEILAEEIKCYLQRRDIVKPVISSACPAVVRLIEVKFPSLLENLLPLDSPLGVVAKIARLEAMKKGYRPREIGIFFITPCPAKVTEVRQSGDDLARVDGAISMSSVYSRLVNELATIEEVIHSQMAGFRGIGWARSGGEQESLGPGEYMAVDGIHHVIAVLEKIEVGELKEVVYCEAQACVGGCIGGVLAVQNPFIAKVNVNHLLQKYNFYAPIEKTHQAEWRKKGVFLRSKPYEAKEVMRLDRDLHRALEKYQTIEKLVEKLPGLDCGACGSPTCRALAEDIVQEKALEVDCPFLLRNRMVDLAVEMYELASKVPQTMIKEEEGKKVGNQNS